MRNYTDRFAAQGTITAGDTVYMEERFGYGFRISEAKAVRTTKTLVVVENSAGVQATFRYNSSGRYVCKGAYDDRELVTKETRDAAAAHDALDKALRTARGTAATAAGTVRARGLTSKALQAIIDELQEQADILKDLGH